MIRSKPATQEYRDNFDRIFRKRSCKLHTDCDKADAEAVKKNIAIAHVPEKKP